MAENKKLKELGSGDVIKLENAGDSISGMLISWEESRMFPGSYAVRLRNPNKEQPQVVFVSNVVIDKIKLNNIQPGQDIMIEFAGLVKSGKSGMSYKNYKVYA
jgi:hypothetical protein